MEQLTMFNLPTKSYHNTVPIESHQHREAEANAKAQESIILSMFHHFGQLTPWQCEARLQAAGKRWPITSIRRSITNLTNQGHLLKTSQKILGPLNHIENVWKII